MTLTKKNLKDVKKLLNEVRRKWYNIGIELGLDIDELDTIKKGNDPDDCLVEMLKVWLRSIDPCPTWVALAEALKSEKEFVLARKGIQYTCYTRLH